MTAAEAYAMADEQIAHWRVRCVCVVDVAPEVRCHRSWPAVRERLVNWLLDTYPDESLAA